MKGISALKIYLFDFIFIFPIIRNCPREGRMVIPMVNIREDVMFRSFKGRFIYFRIVNIEFCNNQMYFDNKLEIKFCVN